MIHFSIPLDSIDYKKYVIIFECVEFIIFSYIRHYRQYRHYLIRDRPKKWRDVVTEEEFKNTQIYNLEKSRFTFGQALVTQVVKVLFWFYDGLARLWDISGGLLTLCGAGASEHQILQTLVCNILFSWLLRIASLPSSMYSELVLNRKHGINKTTMGGFFYDIYMCEKMILELQTPILAACLWVCLCAIRYSGGNFFIYISMISLALNTFAMRGPFFVEHKLLENGDLECSIRSLAARVGFPLKNIYVVHGQSAPLDHSKVYIYGRGKNQSVVLYDILVDDLDNEEICAIVAHELGHWKMGTSMKKFTIGELDTIATYWLLSFIISNDNLYRNFGFHSKPIFIGYTLFQSIYSPISNVINFLSMVFSHQSEYKADAFAMNLGFTSKLRSALIKSSVTTIDSRIDYYTVDSLYSICLNNYPALTERLDQLGIKPASSKPVNLPQCGSKKENVD